MTIYLQDDNENEYKNESETFELFDCTSMSIASRSSMTGWQYDSSVDGSKIITNLGYAMLVSYLVEISTNKNPSLKYLVIKQVETIAMYLISGGGFTKVYYTRDYYERRSTEVSWVMVVASRWDTYWYSDSKRQNLIDSTTCEKYLDGYSD